MRSVTREIKVIRSGQQNIRASIWDIPVLMTTYRTEGEGGGFRHVSKVTGAHGFSHHRERRRSHIAGASNDSRLGCCTEDSNPITSQTQLNILRI